MGGDAKRQKKQNDVCCWECSEENQYQTKKQGEQCELRDIHED
jgi:hypothetical protein